MVRLLRGILDLIEDAVLEGASFGLRAVRSALFQHRGLKPVPRAVFGGVLRLVEEAHEGVPEDLLPRRAATNVQMPHVPGLKADEVAALLEESLAGHHIA